MININRMSFITLCKVQGIVKQFITVPQFVRASTVNCEVKHPCNAYFGGMSMTVIKLRPNSLCCILHLRHIFTKINNLKSPQQRVQLFPCNIRSHVDITAGLKTVFLRLHCYLSKQHATHLNHTSFLWAFLFVLMRFLWGSWPLSFKLLRTLSHFC